MIRYFKSVIEEMRRVTWPTLNQWHRDVISVFIISLFFGLFLWLTDSITDGIIKLLMHK